MKSPCTYGILRMVAVSVADSYVKQVTCFMYGTSPVQHHSYEGARSACSVPYNIPV